MYPQLNLDIQLRVEFRLSNFITDSPQAVELKAQLTQIIELPADQPILIYGEPGCGKSHLLQSVCHIADQQGINAGYLPLAQLANTTPDLLTNLGELELLCIDDIHTIAGQADWERALFNLYNQSREHQRRLLFASRLRPAECGFNLDDLTSRLGWGVIYALPALDDHHKKSLVQQRGKELGLTFDEPTCDYIMQRCDRQTSRLMQFLDQLDQHSLAGQRRITIPLVRELIQLLPEQPSVSRSGRP